MDLDTPFYAAITGESSITALLGEYLSQPAVFTRVPVPVGASYPMIVVMPAAAVANMDGLSAERPLVMKDIIVYGEQDSQYRDVETIAWAVRTLFHRKHDAITVTGYNVAGLSATGPIPAPTSDERHVARAVTLSIQLSQT